MRFFWCSIYFVHKIKLYSFKKSHQQIKLSQKKLQKYINKFITSTMSQNPQSAPLSARTMYQYDHHTNIPWNDPEYNPVRQYLDPNRQIMERKWAAQEKGKKDTKYVTKKGFYMDYHIKVVKGLPAASAYNLGDPWDQTENKKEGTNRKIDPKLMKYTYIERIEMEEKNRKKPAPGSYNLNKTDAQIKEELDRWRTKKIHHGPKRYFFQDSEFLSNLHPGAGAQNPHLSVDHIKPNKTTHKFWIDKHKKDNAYWSKKRASEPGPTKYSPCHLEFNTFIRTANTEKSRKKQQNKNGFGSDAKFVYDRTPKKKILEVRPTPSTYKMEIQWKGKNMDSKRNNWIRSRSTGFSQSVYNG